MREPGAEKELLDLTIRRVCVKLLVFGTICVWIVVTLIAFFRRG